MISRSRRLVFLTRQGALAAARSAYPHRARTPARMALSLLAGSTLIGIGVALFIHAKLGLPPYDVLLSAISRLTGITHGQAAWVASAVLMGVASLFGRRPSPSAVVFILANGIAVDTARFLIVSPTSLALRIGFATLGILAISGGISLVLHSGTTGGPFELLQKVAVDHGGNETRFRTMFELSILAAGVVAGGSFGPATLAFALLIGPIMRAALIALGDHREGRRYRLEKTA